MDVGSHAADYRSQDENVGTSVIYVARNRQVLGWIGLRDGIRPAAEPAVRELNDMGIKLCCMVTGDNQAVARTVARKIGIREISAECLPEQKVAYVEALKKKGYTVAVVGDGVNDAPALAAGDIGIAMGAIGSDVAINSASIALMNNDLRRIPFLIALTRKTRTIINTNLAIGLVLIVGGIMLFLFGNDLLDKLAKTWSLSPTIMKAAMAAAMHIFGTLVVVFNSARLVRFGEQLETLE
jgi:Zn2+/Cd2+-exporting ATPase